MRIKIHNWLKKEVDVLTIIYFLLTLIVFISIFIGLGKITNIFNNDGFLHWDADWYYSIVEKGYFFQAEIQSNAGFFPGFPFFWKLIGLNAVGISCVNFVLFLCSFFVLAKLFNTSNLKALAILCIPSIFFFYVPYSEALFYAFSTLAICAWKKKNWTLLIIGLVFLAFVRPVVVFLLPSVLITYLFQLNWKKIWIPFVCSLSLILGTFLGFLYIGSETGNFFAYFKSQTTNWNHSFSLPGFPLTTWRGYRILWIDAWALLIAVSATIFLIKISYQTWFKKQLKSLDNISILSLCYICLTLIYVLFFHPKDDGHTSILSLNRYLFCNPFLHYLLLKYLFSVQPSKKVYLTIGLTIVFCLFILGFPYYSVVGLNYNQTLLYFVCLFAFLGGQALFVLKFKKSNPILYLSIIIFNTLLQVYVFQGFLKGNWIG